MAILDLNKYYYFRMSNGRPYAIKESLIEINTTIMRNFQAFTQEQLDFYFEHPTASVMEVWNCELIPPYVPPTPDVSEYAAMKVKELKDACYASVTVDDLKYAMANSILAGTALTYTGTRYYTTNEAKAIMKTFMDESAHAMDVYDTYKPQIEAASTIEEVDTIYEQAISQL